MEPVRCKPAAQCGLNLGQESGYVEIADLVGHWLIARLIAHPPDWTVDSNPGYDLEGHLYCFEQ